MKSSWVLPSIVGIVLATPLLAGTGGESVQEKERGEEVTLGRQGDLRLFLAGSCGPEEEGRHAVLENRGSHDAVTASIETSVWTDGWLRSSAVSRHTVQPLAEERLGCTLRSGGAEWRYSIVEVSSAASQRTVRHGHDRPARSAVKIVDSGSCGRGRAGHWHSLINQHPEREISVSVEVQETVDGDAGRRYRKNLRLPPGASHRLGCSQDGPLARTVTVLEAEYR